MFGLDEIPLSLIEEGSGELHLHGEIWFDPSLADAIRQALDDAGGNWVSPGKGYAAVHFKSNPNTNWAGYCVKYARKATPERRRLMRRYGVTRSEFLARFDGKAVTATKDINRAAAELHRAAVAEVIAFRKAQASAGNVSPAKPSASPYRAAQRSAALALTGGSGTVRPYAAPPVPGIAD